MILTINSASFEFSIQEQKLKIKFSTIEYTFAPKVQV